MSDETQDANDWKKEGGRFNANDAEPVEPMPDDPLRTLWRTVGEWGADWLTKDPPPRRYLLTGADGKGVLPLGRVGMLASAGGQGKSWALCQLALCVAAGVDWLGTFKVAEGGYVLLALAEEEAEEMRRRLFYGAKALGLDDEKLALVAERIVALPLCGESVALTYSPEEARGFNAPPGTILETTFASRLRAKLHDAEHEWRLIVLDPISRFAGPDVEGDNAAATRFVQVLEKLTQVPGHPTLLVAHHTSKAARREGGADASAARGASGLTDAVRWQANLMPVKDAPDFVKFEVTKSNYAKFPPRLVLRRQEHGELRRATKPDIDAMKDQIAAAKAERDQAGEGKQGAKAKAEKPKRDGRAAAAGFDAAEDAGL